MPASPAGRVVAFAPAVLVDALRQPARVDRAERVVEQTMSGRGRMDFGVQELNDVEALRKSVDGYRVVRIGGKFKVVEATKKSSQDSGVLDSNVAGQRQVKEAWATAEKAPRAGRVAAKRHDFKYRIKSPAASYQRMQANLYGRDPILRPESGEYRFTKSIVPSNIDRLFGTDPILRQPEERSRPMPLHSKQYGQELSKRRSLMPSNGNRDPIVEGDDLQFRPSKRSVPEYFDKLGSKFFERRPCRGRRKQADPDSAGASSELIGHMNPDIHFTAKSARSTRKVVPSHPKDGQEHKFKVSRGWTVNSHILHSRNPILQTNDEHFPADRPHGKGTNPRHLQTSDPTKTEYVWKPSRALVAKRGTNNESLTMLSRDTKSKAFEVSGYGDGTRLYHEPQSRTYKKWNQSSTVFNYANSGGISDDLARSDRVSRRRAYEAALMEVHKSPRARKPETSSHHLDTNHNVFQHQGQAFDPNAPRFYRS